MGCIFVGKEGAGRWGLEKIREIKGRRQAQTGPRIEQKLFQGNQAGSKPISFNFFTRSGCF